MGIGDWIGRKKLTTLASRDERFSIQVLGKVLCPYCLKTQPVAGSPAGTVIDHALTTCEPFDGT